MASGTVKFFNDAKGFGFIAPEDGGSDIFVHISAVERSGLNGLGEGDIVSFEVEQDRRSGKLAAVHLEFISAGAAPARSPRGGGGGGGGGGYGRQDHAPRDYGSRDHAPRGGGGGGATSGSGSGVVKWFNTTKGFGFIQPSDGGADVFVHISAVERAGLNGLNEGQSVSYDIEQDRKTGKLAVANLRVSR